MTDTAKYLNEFSRLENVLRETETAKSVLDYENSRDAKIHLTTPHMEELVGA